jgi:predicted Rossmann fold nucleotide-binding protein DprA/Smf involved in DNA uptake
LLAARKATGVTDGSELVRALAGEPVVRRPPVALAPLVALLAAGPVEPVEISRRLDITLPAALALVAEAELDGWVRRFPGGGIASLNPPATRSHAQSSRSLTRPERDPRGS